VIAWIALAFALFAWALIFFVIAGLALAKRKLWPQIEPLLGMFSPPK
jgi:hypothetical protein